MAMDMKRIETRGFATHGRGDLAIHASLRKLPGDFVCALYRSVGLPLPGVLPRGVILCVVDVFDVMRSEDVMAAAQAGPVMTAGGQSFNLANELKLGNYGPKRYGWLTRNLRVLKEPLPFSGVQGRRSLPDDVAAEVRRRCA